MQIQEIIHQTSKNYYQELKTAASQKKSSLKYLVLTPPNQLLLGSPKLIQTLVIGGTNTTHSTVHIFEDSFEIASSKTMPTPQLLNQTTLDEFILNTASSTIPQLAINLAFPIEPVSSTHYPDGILLQGSKEHPLENLSSEPLGSHLKALLERQYQQTFEVTVANDIHCLLLAGIYTKNNTNVVSVVLGTGVNMGFVHNKQLVNLESGGFSEFPRSDIFNQIDQALEDPGFHLFEKATAGRYLYLYYNYLQKQSGQNQIISSTKQLCQIAGDPNHHQQNIAEQILDTSAALVVAQVSGMHQFINSPNLELIVEGSLYWSCQNYKQSFQKYLGSLGIDSQLTISRIPESSIVGAIQLFNPNVFYLLGTA